MNNYRREFVFCGIEQDIDGWNCMYGYDNECPIIFLDENNDITKGVWRGSYYSDNVNMNKLIRYLYNL